MTEKKIAHKDFTGETLALTSQLLRQNPEYYTIWNNRRLILQDAFAKEITTAQQEGSLAQGEAPTSTDKLAPAEHEISLLIKEDLAFLIPLLRQFPKCYWIWNHRIWLLEQAASYLPSTAAQEFWKAEMGLVEKMLSYDSRNFNGWNYRRRIVHALETLRTGEIQKLEGQRTDLEHSAQASMAASEFAYSTKMVKTNLSNFSAWHNRSQLIPRMLKDRKADGAARRKMLDDEMLLITEALYTDPYDQSLWFYHQYLMTTLSPRCPASALIVLDLTNHDRLDYLKQQLDMLKDLMDGSEDCKWIYQALLTYSAAYMDIEAGNKQVTTLDMRSWLDKLEELDALRKGRWQDWRGTLDL